MTFTTILFNNPKNGRMVGYIFNFGGGASALAIGDYRNAD